MITSMIEDHKRWYVWDISEDAWQPSKEFERVGAHIE